METVDFHLGVTYARMKNPKAVYHLDRYIGAEPDDPAGYDAMGNHMLEAPGFSENREKGCEYLRKACILGWCDSLNRRKSENICMQ